LAITGEYSMVVTIIEGPPRGGAVEIEQPLEVMAVNLRKPRARLIHLP
jgi:hypothetical protein